MREKGSWAIWAARALFFRDEFDDIRTNVCESRKPVSIPVFQSHEPPNQYWDQNLVPNRPTHSYQFVECKWRKEHECRGIEEFRNIIFGSAVTNGGNERKPILKQFRDFQGPLLMPHKTYISLTRPSIIGHELAKCGFIAFYYGSFSFYTTGMVLMANS